LTNNAIVGAVVCLGCANGTVISKVVANRAAIRQRVVSSLSPEQLKKWDDEKAKA